MNTPPRWVFHVWLVVLSALLLWSASYPGSGALEGLGVLALIGFSAVVWAVRLIGFWRSGERRDPRRRWFAAAPGGALLVMAMLYGGVPLSVRFAASRSAFDRAVVASHDSASAERIGLFTITVIDRRGRNVFFYEKHGDLFDDAGFAYLPDGPSADLGNGNFENPEFRHLSGDWYAWTASF